MSSVYTCMNVFVCMYMCVCVYMCVSVYIYIRNRCTVMENKPMVSTGESEGGLN